MEERLDYNLRIAKGLAPVVIRIIAEAAGIGRRHNEANSNTDAVAVAVTVAETAAITLDYSASHRIAVFGLYLHRAPLDRLSRLSTAPMAAVVVVAVA